MIRLRTWAAVLGLAVLLAGVAAAGNGTKGAGKGNGAKLERLIQLLPAGADDKLKLTDDERKQIDKIQAEFTDKTKDQVAQVRDAYLQNRDAIKKARQDKDKQALKTAMAPVREKLKDFMKARRDYEAKVRDVLTDDQKKTFDELVQAHHKGKAKPKAAALNNP